MPARPLGLREFRLMCEADSLLEKRTGRPALGPNMAALKGSKDVDGKALPYLPAPLCDAIVAHLDPESKASLMVTWGGRLRAPAQQAMLRKIAHVYGFRSDPKQLSWQDHLDALTSEKHLPQAASTQADAALASMLLGTLSPCEAVEQCSDSREVVMRAVELDPSAFEHASEALRDDREVVKHAIRQDPWTVQYASARLQNDREVAIFAIEQPVSDTDKSVLEALCAAMQDDEEVVARAVEKDGFALQYASARLRNKRDLVMRVVDRQGCALDLASASLRADREVVAHAIANNGWALFAASYELQQDPDLRKLSGLFSS